MKISRADSVAVALLLLFLLALFPPAAFSPSHLFASPYSDAITQYLPHQLFIRQSLIGDACVPLWNPYECAGTPAFPNPLYPTLALPHVLLAPLPPALALNAGFFLNVFLAGLFTYAYARYIGCSRPASLLAALIFSMSARSLSHIQAGFYSRMSFYALIPLLFLCAERCFTRPGIRSTALIACSLTLALLTGSIQLLLYALFFIILYALIRLRVNPGRAAGGASRPGSLSCLFAGMLLFIPLSAFYLLPAWRLYPLLTRSRPLGAAQFSFMATLPLGRLFLNPRLLGDFSPGGCLSWEFALYIGLAPLLLIGCALTRRESRRALYLWGLLGLTAVILSLEGARPLHHLVNRVAPPLGSFRNPGRILSFLPFFGAILAARGLSALSSLGKERTGLSRLMPWWCLFVIGAALLCAALHAHARLDGDTLVRNYRARFSGFFGERQTALINLDEVRHKAASYREGVRRSFLFQFVILAALAALLGCRASGIARASFFTTAVIAVTAADLFFFGRPYLETQPLKELYPPTPLYRTLERQDGYFRLLDISAPFPAAFWTDLPSLQSTGLKISRITGYSPVNLESYARYVDLMTGLTNPFPRWSITAPSIRHPMLLSLLNAEFIISETPIRHAALSLVREFRELPVTRQFLGKRTVPRLFLYRNADSLPRAWLVPEAERRDDEAAFRELPLLNPRKKAIIPPDAPPVSAGEPFTPVEISRYEPNRIEMEVETSRASYLVLSEVWAPGWRAWDNGKPLRVVRVDGILRGLYLDGGRHRIVFSYRPPGLAAGSALSVITAMGVIAACLWGKGIKTVES